MEIVLKDKTTGSAVRVTIESLEDNSGTGRDPMLDQVIEDVVIEGLETWWVATEEIEWTTDGYVIPDDERLPER